MTPLWTPKNPKNSQMYAFMQGINQRYKTNLSDYNSLWQWSVDNLAQFWDAVWDTCGVIGDKGDTILPTDKDMQSTRYYPNGQLNFTQNLLRKNDDTLAIVFHGENKVERTLTWAQLHDQVSRLRQVLISAGVQSGDRVAGYLPNMPEAVIGLLATASIGAVWSSASPDFGVQGILDRFGQIEPKVLIACDAYWYNGKNLDCLDKLREIIPQIPSLKTTLIVNYADDKNAALPIGATSYESALAQQTGGDIPYPKFAFNHPLVILYSSGTTGAPKCIVHGAGGTLLQHLKEHQLQCDVKPNDRVFYFTTCGWMMWNWLASALASQATLILYDGSPFFPKAERLFDIADEQGVTLFGTAAKYIDALRKFDLRPIDTHSLKTIRTLTSTGSPLVHESFDYIYSNIKSDIHVASISGGTDIVSCFVIGNPISPVYSGQIQGAGLGLAVDIFDDDGHPITTPNVSGELVCTKPFPSMPVKFWNDTNNTKYTAAYFDRFTKPKPIWSHGDWIQHTPENGLVITGRSDATLKPGGVRIGTAEIYRQVEQVDGVLESLAVGQDWDNDTRVILFVKLKDGVSLDTKLTDMLKHQIKIGASPRHVPAKIIAVPDLPRTKSGKLVELAVRDIIHGRVIKNRESLANPESLAYFADLPALAT